MPQATIIPDLSQNPPARSDPSTFDPRGASLLADLPNLVDKVNAVVSELNTWNTATETDKTSTGASKTASIASEQAAKTSALASAQRSAVWTSGVNYSVGYLVESPITARQYRCILSGVSTIDPSSDSTRWALLGFDFNTQLPNLKPTLNLNFAKTKILDPRITFTRNSVGTYFDSIGNIQTASVNQVRFDHDPITGESLGLLIEEQRTNLLLNSSSLSTQSVTVSATAYTLSFYGTGSITLSGASTGTLTGTGGFPTRVTLTFTPTAGTLILTVTGSVQYAQLEAGAFATSYIPTTGTSVQRQADDVSMQGVNFSNWYRQDEGTFFLNIRPKVFNGACGIQSNDGTAANKVRLCIVSSTGQSTVTVNNVNVAILDAGEPLLNQDNALALSYKKDDFALSLLGGAAVLDTDGTLPLVKELQIGKQTSSLYMSGTIKNIQFYPQKVSQNSLRYLTS